MGKNVMHTELAPFCRGGDLYFVGTKEENCHILKTSEGLIMIDVGSEPNLPFVLDGMEKLGLALQDLKILLLSHWHGDHSAAVPLLRRACRQAGGDFKVLIGERDVPYLNFPPDAVIRDGDVITLGETKIRCVASPGHTAGTTSFFFTIETGGRTVRCGMFGGAGTGQLAHDFLEGRKLSRLMRREYFATLEKLKKEPVEMLVGNHTWNDKLPETYALWEKRDFDEKENPFIDPARWQTFLIGCRKKLLDVIASETVAHFVNYAHRGRSDIYHGNTMPAFLAGVEARANGIETDLRRTADGVLILFHDKTLKGLGQPDRAVSEVSFEELTEMMTAAWGEAYRPVTAETFLRTFGPLDLSLALELKEAGIAEETVALARRYAKRKNVTFTSFTPAYLDEVHALAPDWHLGQLVKAGTAADADMDAFFARGVEEICPFAGDIDPDFVSRWHEGGFTVRAWGVSDEETMRRLVEAGVDGITVNFPQKLTALLDERNALRG